MSAYLEARKRGDRRGQHYAAEAAKARTTRELLAWKAQASRNPLVEFGEIQEVKPKGFLRKLVEFLHYA